MSDEQWAMSKNQRKQRKLDSGFRRNDGYGMKPKETRKARSFADAQDDNLLSFSRLSPMTYHQ